MVHWYAFIFYEDWHQDVFMKRFVRDNFYYLDEIQCAAARVVEQVRSRSRANGAANGSFMSFHIRRGDFQYHQAQMTPQQIYDTTASIAVPENTTLFIATDELNRTVFDPLARHYNLLFLGDFPEQTRGVNPNYYGMLDQVIASRGLEFFGTYYSTFSGYINRLRGYHTQATDPPSATGAMRSYYYVSESLVQFRQVMRGYEPVRPPYWSQEFPVGWRDIDHDVIS